MHDTRPNSLGPPPQPPPGPEGVPSVLFVDDEVPILEAMRRSLHCSVTPWKCRFASSAEEALRAARESTPDVIVTDVQMPGRDGFFLLAEARQDPILSRVPVVIVTGMHDRDIKRMALDAGAVDLLSKPVSSEDLIARVSSVLRIKSYEDRLRWQAERLNDLVRERTRQLEQSQLEITLRLASVGEYRDSDTGQHVVRVAHIARLLARAMSLPQDETERLFVASTLHDIGKVGVPDGILRKPGKLTEDERREMQKHCEYGYAILCSSTCRLTTNDIGQVAPGNQAPCDNEWLRAAGVIALCHHERWDGSGYPHGLKGDKIPLSARIVAAADLVDALASERPYKKAFPMQEVRAIVEASSGNHLDPVVAAHLLRIWPEVQSVVTMYADAKDAWPQAA